MPFSDRSREWLFRLVYAWRLVGENSDQVGSDIGDRFVLSDTDWDALAQVSPYLPDPRLGREKATRWHALEKSVLGALSRIQSTISEIDSAIQTASPRWRLERMPPIDRALLVLGTYELVIVGARPAKRIINRTVELAKRYGAQDSRRFVNGILDQIRKDHGIESS